MTALPYALALIDPRGSGRLDYLATFADPADLWTFWKVWRAEVEPATTHYARFVYTGRFIHATAPPPSREAFDTALKEEWTQP